MCVCVCVHARVHACVCKQVSVVANSFSILLEPDDTCNYCVTDCSLLHSLASSLGSGLPLSWEGTGVLPEAPIFFLFGFYPFLSLFLSLSLSLTHTHTRTHLYIEWRTNFLPCMRILTCKAAYFYSKLYL